MLEGERRRPRHHDQHAVGADRRAAVRRVRRRRRARWPPRHRRWPASSASTAFGSTACIPATSGARRSSGTSTTWPSRTARRFDEEYAKIADQTCLGLHHAVRGDRRRRRVLRIAAQPSDHRSGLVGELRPLPVGTVSSRDGRTGDIASSRDAGRDGPRPVHDLPRRDDRERRAARHPARVRRRRAGPAVGGRGLQPDDGHVHHVEREPGRPPRPASSCSSAAIVVFAAASVACGLAPGIDVLAVARGVQGVGAAMVNVVVAGVGERGLSRTPTPRPRRSARGPASPRSVSRSVRPWAVCSPKGSAGAASSCQRLRRLPPRSFGVPLRRRVTRSDRAQRSILPGQLLFIVGVGALTYALIEAPHSGWLSPLILGVAHRRPSSSWSCSSWPSCDQRRPDDGRARLQGSRVQHGDRARSSPCCSRSTARCSSSRSTSRTSRTTAPSRPGS